MDDARQRLGRRSAKWWRTETAAGRTRAAAVGALVAGVAGMVARLEGEDRGAPPAPPREDVLVDQFAVVAYDLLLALGAAPDPQAARDAETLISRTLAEVDPR